MEQKVLALALGSASGNVNQEGCRESVLFGTGSVSFNLINRAKLSV
jgi:hypothetical protein